MKLSIKTFMSTMFFVGFVLTFFALKISSKVKDCNANVQNAARGLLVIGVTLISVSSTFIVCGCGKGVQHSTLGTLFVNLMFAIGIITMVLTFNIHRYCDNAKSDTPFLLSISIFTTFLCGYLLYQKYYSKLNMNSSF
jgi:hypothetical protein